MDGVTNVLRDERGYTVAFQVAPSKSNKEDGLETRVVAGTVVGGMVLVGLLLFGSCFTHSLRSITRETTSRS